MIASRAKWVLIVSVTVIVALPVGFFLYLWFPLRAHVQISGLVIDKVSGVPIPDAKVLIALRRKGFPYDGYSAIGTFSDANGRFNIDSVTKRPFHDVLMIEAATTNGGYGRTGEQDGKVTVEIELTSVSKTNSKLYNYTFFRGCCLFGHDPDITFVGPGWSIEGR